VLHVVLSPAGALAGMQGNEPEVYVRCSDPNVICETKNMVPLTLPCCFVLYPSAVVRCFHQPCTHGSILIYWPLGMKMKHWRW